MAQEPRCVRQGLVVSILVALALWAPRAYPAMEMQLVDDTLYLLTGYIEREDWTRYQELTRGKRFSTVVLANQGGGWGDPALGIAEDLIRRRVDTIALGYCRGACTFMFLAGVHRQFAANGPLGRTHLGFHSAYHHFFGNQVSYRATVSAYYLSRLPKGGQELVLRAVDEITDVRGHLYVYHPSHRTDAELCPGSPEKKCERIANADALTLGMITTKELASIVVPEKLAVKETLFGLDLGVFQRISNPTDIESYCTGAAPACVQAARRFMTRPLERAIAVSSSGKAASAWQSGSARRATWRAMYYCVRNAGEPCHIVAVNEVATEQLYAGWGRESAEALEALRARKAEEIPQERYDQTELRMSQLRTDRFVGPTPESIPGVKEVDTRQLVMMLTGAGGAELIDVACVDQTLPTAKCIFHGGMAYADASADQAQQKLFAMLLDALSGGRPVVMFSADSRSWLSANAALRAAKAGKNVYWYRGGIAAWRTAGLPTVPTAPFGAAAE